MRRFKNISSRRSCSLPVNQVLIRTRPLQKVVLNSKSIADVCLGSESWVGGRIECKPQVFIRSATGAELGGGLNMSL